MNFGEWLAQSWVYLAAFASGLALIVALVKNVKIIMKDITRPLEEIKADVKIIKDRQEVQEEATKGLLRDRMLTSYNFCRARGYATPIDKQSFESMFSQYEALKGKNGFMEDRYKRFMNFPEQPDED